MPSAKTLTEKEMRKVLNYISLHKHAARNRAMLQMTFLCGLRVMEVASLRIGDVWSFDGTVKDEIRLLPEMTKGKFPRTVYLGEKIRKELIAYLATIDRSNLSKPLFYTQKRDGFTANTMCQHFHWLYKRAGIEGASSHSGRRNFCTTLSAQGVGIRTIMALSGHRSLSSVQKYLDVNDDMLRKAIELV